MKIIKVSGKITNNLIGLEKSELYRFLVGSQQFDLQVEEVVKKIIADVRTRKDKALIDYSNRFDGTSFKKEKDFCVTDTEFNLAEKSLTPEVKKAIKTAYSRIKSYHQKQLPQDFFFKDKIGVELGNCWRAIESVGVYVPGGTASYPSSVLMSVVPALVAGVKNIVICAPSSAGKLNHAVLYAAKICGVEKVYKLGGAQAIAALACGTKTIAKVNKIVGPGNSYVASAKKILFGEVGIDMIAGPTDVTIIADQLNNPDWLAADAISQLEHGVDSKAFIITDNSALASKILASIQVLKEQLSRKKIINESLKNSAIIVIKDLADAAHLANFIAPEHLEIATKNPQKFLAKIQNAGAIFLGRYTPEAIGDYIAGPSHTLPTSSSAKFSSGLSVFDFLKRMSVIACNHGSFQALSDDTIALAEYEGLSGHSLSVKIRKESKLT